MQLALVEPEVPIINLRTILTRFSQLRILRNLCSARTISSSLPLLSFRSSSYLQHNLIAFPSGLPSHNILSTIVLLYPVLHNERVSQTIHLPYALSCRFRSKSAWPSNGACWRTPRMSYFLDPPRRLALARRLSF